MKKNELTKMYTPLTMMAQNYQHISVNMVILLWYGGLVLLLSKAIDVLDGIGNSSEALMRIQCQALWSFFEKWIAHPFEIC